MSSSSNYFENEKTNFSVTQSSEIKGTDPFEDMIFYFWADSKEICTAYVKFKINHILFVKKF